MVDSCVSVNTGSNVTSVSVTVYVTTGAILTVLSDITVSLLVVTLSVVTTSVLVLVPYSVSVDPSEYVNV